MEKRVERKSRYLKNFEFNDDFEFKNDSFQHFSISKSWQAWETAWLFRLPSIINNPHVPARMIEAGCWINGERNCYRACGNKTSLFGTPETLWNCLTLATVAMMTTGKDAPDTISNETVHNLTETFKTGPLNQFWNRYALLNYVKCAQQSCSDSKFGGCPPDLWNFECQAITHQSIRSLGHIMSQEYCQKADPGIDYDIAGPGIIVAYFIQFTIVLFFALSYKITKTWARNLTLVFVLPFKGWTNSLEIARPLQYKVSGSNFSAVVGSTIVDLQEAQAVFLATISVAAIIAFSGSSTTGLANISSLLSWVANNLSLRGMVSAGMYPLLLVQLILHKARERWWYTLLLVVINWILVLFIVRPQTADGDSLRRHFDESAGLDRCGNHPGPRTYCQTFNKPVGITNSTTDEELQSPNYLDRDAKSFFKFHSRIQAPIHVIMAFLILDWAISIIKMHLSHRAKAWMNKIPSSLRSFPTQRYFLLLKEVLWVSMEVLTIVMGAIGVHEFAAFMRLLGGGESGNDSPVALSKWAFGQLVAVCVWIPVVLKFSCLI